MSELTIEDKREALKEAGKKIRSNASDLTIEEAFAELQGGKPTPEPTLEPTPKPEKTPVVKSPKKAVQSNTNSAMTIQEKIAEIGDISLGDRNPEVIAWARENISKEEFKARYAGRI
jgi:hypothetical protein